MYGKKRCPPCYVSHPILCGMIVGFGVIGVWGVFLAAKQKASKLAQAAQKAGGACVESVKDTAANLMENGAEALGAMAEKKQGN